MEFRDGRYIGRIYYAELRRPGLPPGNLMGTTFYDPGEPIVWHFEYRFRYYVDDDHTFASKDRKTWYEVAGEPGAAISELTPTIRMMFEAAGNGSFEEVIIESDQVAMQYQRLAEQPWAHLEHLTQEEFDAARSASKS